HGAGHRAAGARGRGAHPRGPRRGEDGMRPGRFHGARLLMLVLLVGPPGMALGQEHADDAAPADDAEQATGARAAGDRPWAEGVPFEAQVQARDLCMEGNVLLRDTLFAQAAAKLEEAVALWAHPAFLYNLALARIH